MNSQQLFPQIGKVIASTGSRRFPRMLHDLILTQLSVDATHIRKLPTGSQTTAVTAHADSQIITHGEPISTASDAKESALHLTRRKDDCSYTLSVYRSSPSQHFSAQERSILQDFSPLLLPMVEKHISALHPLSPPLDSQSGQLDDMESQGLQALRLRFVDRLVQSGLTLSNRETDVCVGLLSGRTAPVLAEMLQLKVNTVESYLKRASIKLGISGRHSLMRWMYAAEEAPAAVMPTVPL
ncbi:helix-turn-helix transcriptional regulator [Pseudomonas asplenii]|uniref:helix-turn-helix transcriptional regulator n=1 Tax=Pseudomonas asplenii TaxID=53407 RepID=UPI0003816929|nr:LuxR C-terminal-related transcriptional regulator [Pseudomonas fuscovaginae]